MKLLPFMKLVRISALPSALADVFGGMALAALLVSRAGYGHLDLARLPWLLGVTVGVYLLGMAMNDLLHYEKDRRLGKSRPLVTGELTPGQARAVCIALYALTAICAILADVVWPALALVLLIYVYNWLARGEFRWAGPLSVPVIALCRAIHVSLPVFAVAAPSLLMRQPEWWLFAGSVFAYFCLVTTVSLFEDRGGGRAALATIRWPLIPALFALPFYLLGRPGAPHDWLLGAALPLLVLGYHWVLMTRLLDTARAKPTPPNIGRTVGAGIRGEALVMCGFALALAPTQPWWGLLALGCWPLGKLLSRWISPT